MRRRQRAFCNHEPLVSIAVIAIIAAIVIPVITKAMQRAHPHSTKFFIAAGQSLFLSCAKTALVVTICVLAPFLLALPFACYAKLSGRRTTPFYALWSEYRDKSLPWLVGALFLAGVILMVRDSMLLPIVHFFKFRYS